MFFQFAMLAYSLLILEAAVMFALAVLGFVYLLVAASKQPPKAA